MGTFQIFPPVSTSVALTGDVITSGDVATVVGIQSTPVNSTPPTDDQVLDFNATAGEWMPTTLNQFLDIDVTASGGTIVLTADQLRATRFFEFIGFYGATTSVTVKFPNGFGGPVYILNSTFDGISAFNVIQVTDIAGSNTLPVPFGQGVSIGINPLTAFAPGPVFQGISNIFVDSTLQATGLGDLDFQAGPGVTIAGGSGGQVIFSAGAAATIQHATTTFNPNLGDVVLCDTTGGGFTVTLPAVTAGNAGQIIRVKKISSDGNTVTIATTGGNLIDGAATQSTNIQYTSIDFQSDGVSNWEIV